MNTTELKQALRNGRYAWPCGYPTFFVADDGQALCHDCVRDNFRDVVEAIKKHSRSGWRVDGHAINYDDAYLTCDDCGAFIESAYAEREGGEV